MDKFFFLCLIFILVGGLCTVGSMVDPFIDPGNTVGENIIATIKMRNNFCYPLKVFFFSIAPHLVRYPSSDFAIVKVVTLNLFA